MNHTPAPWLRDGLTVYALTKDHRGRECNRFTATVQSARQRHEAWEVELRANAELMRLAPELLAACEFALECATVPVYGLEAQREKAAKVVALLEDAIAKARGEG